MHTPTSPWREAFADAADWDAVIEAGTLPALLDGALAAYPERAFIEFRDRTMVMREFGERVAGLAAGLLAAGVGPGTVIAHYLPNTPWFPICFFAAARAGARIVHLSPLDAPRELAHKLRDSGARTLVTTNCGLLAGAVRMLDEGVVERVLVGADEVWGPSPATETIAWRPGLSALPEAAVPASWPEVTPDDVAVIQYTGGTTGLPKGAMLTHGNLTAANAIYRAWRRTAFDEGSERRVIVVLPLFHIYALTTLLLRSVSDGSEMLLRPRFDVETLLDDIGRKRASSFAGVPTMWIALANHPAAAACDFSCLRECVSGGAALPFEVQLRVGDLIGRRLMNGWGMTETSPAGTRAAPDAEPQPNLIGIPLPGIEMRIVSLDDPALALSAGETGEIAIRGPNVFAGYWNRPEETARSFANGWFLTGDIGRMDGRGQFFLLDRKKNMIISSGFNVYPAAIEQAIYEHPDVVETVVIGIDDDYRGQAAKAFVVLKPGAGALSLEELRIFLADRVGRHEMPAALELRDNLPKSPVGKLLAKVLIDEEAAKREGVHA